MSGPPRYDLWVETAGADPRRAETAVAVVLGLDPRAARALVASGNPVGRRRTRAEALSLRERLAARGAAVRAEPPLGDPPPPVDTAPPPDGAPASLPPAGCWLAALGPPVGVAVGGLAERAVATAPGRPAPVGSALIAGAVLATWAAGLLWARARGPLTTRGWLAAAASAAALLAAGLTLPRAAERAFERDRSSDDTGAAAALVTAAACLAAGGPLTLRAASSGRPRRPDAAP